MDEGTQRLAAARASADRQMALNQSALDDLVRVVRKRIAEGRDIIDIWALLGDQVCEKLECHGKYPQFAAEMLVTATIRLAQSTGDTGDDG